MSISICMRLGYTGPDSLAHFLALSLPSSLTLSLFHSLILSYSCSCSHATRASNTRYMRVTRYSHSSHPGHLGLRLFGPCKPQACHSAAGPLAGQIALRSLMPLRPPDRGMMLVGPLMLLVLLRPLKSLTQCYSGHSDHSAHVIGATRATGGP